LSRSFNASGGRALNAGRGNCGGIAPQYPPADGAPLPPFLLLLPLLQFLLCVYVTAGDDDEAGGLGVGAADIVGALSLGLGILGAGAAAVAAAAPASGDTDPPLSPRTAMLLNSAGGWPDAGDGSGSHLDGLPMQAALPAQLQDVADTDGLPREVAASFAELCCGLHSDEGMPPLDKCVACCSDGCTQHAIDGHSERQYALG
jgi:hypothetical protein